MKLVNKRSVAAAILLIVIAAVFLGVDAALKSVDSTSIPEPIRAFVAALQMVFGLPVTVFVLALVSNFYGYYRVQVQAALSNSPDVVYSFDKFGKQVGLYVAVGIGAFAALPPPWNLAAVAMIFIVDIASNEVKWLFQK